MDYLDLPQRTSGERTYGLTSIIDLGTSIGELTHILEDYSSFIDIAKIGIGSAYVTPILQKKIDLYKQFGIKPYCGGTLFEKCYYQNKLPQYLRSLTDLGIEWVEVSNGTIDIPLHERLKLISEIKQDFHVIAEVGSKDSGDNLTVFEWVNEMKQLLDAGSEYVITEGRDSGTSGIYEDNGQIKSNLIHQLVEEVDYMKIIFEAPTPKQQMYFINLLGANVNVGNVKISEVLVLETQRCGLRSETFFVEEQGCKLPL
ncbi:phosphosulfolactate synthase [Bacillus benzoevorans]|uniref:Phosphosulfolactate synthase n=1 Tax=Bacillus benzoevorans TaxID=1456 RepID=A0A7X0HTN4_9BACI|nr:phosphosulfolactate synthase [Bacillus benzoevorans]MBB6446655.1 phosphosulfolactate synthase [Bacillus benzoevorans]